MIHRAIQLHDKYNEDIIGTVLLKEQTTFDQITDAWDKYQRYHNSNREEEADIYEFVETDGHELCEVLILDFYQP